MAQLDITSVIVRCSEEAQHLSQVAFFETHYLHLGKGVREVELKVTFQSLEPDRHDRELAAFAMDDERALCHVEVTQPQEPQLVLAKPQERVELNSDLITK